MIINSSDQAEAFSQLIETALLLARQNDDREIVLLFQSKTAEYHQDYPQAKAYLEQAIEISDTAYLRRSLAQILYKMKQYAAALASLEQAIEIRQHYKNHYEKGRVLAALEDKENAVREYEQAAALCPDDANLFFNLGEELVDLQRYQPALVNYDRAIQLNPENFLFYREKANALLQSEGNNLLALEALEKALALKEEDHRLFRLKAVALFRLARYEIAIETYDRALALKPDDYLSRYEKGAALEAIDVKQSSNWIVAYCDIREGQSIAMKDLAIAEYDKALAIKPDCFIALRNKAFCLGDVHQKKAALEVLEKALALKPDDVSCLSAKAAWLEGEAAIETYDKAIAIQSDHYWLYLNKGQELAALGKHDQAVTEYDRALAIDSECETTREQKGISLARLGRDQEAIAEFDRQIAINPENYRPYRHKSICLANLGQEAAGIETFKQSHALSSIAHSCREIPFRIPPHLQGPKEQPDGFEKTALKLKAKERSIVVDPANIVDPLNREGDLNHCYFGIPANQLHGSVELCRFPPNPVGFHFYLGKAGETLIRAYVASPYPEKTRSLSVGCSFEFADSRSDSITFDYRFYDYTTITELLGGCVFSNLQTLTLGAWEDGMGGENMHGKLGDITPLLKGAKNLNKLCLCGYFELAKPLKLERLEELSLDQDGFFDQHRGISNDTLRYLLDAPYPSLKRLILELETDDATVTYELPQALLEGANVPNLELLVISGTFRRGEKERLINSPLGRNVRLRIENMVSG